MSAWEGSAWQRAQEDAQEKREARERALQHRDRPLAPYEITPPPPTVDYGEREVIAAVKRINRLLDRGEREISWSKVPRMRHYGSRGEVHRRFEGAGWTVTLTATHLMFETPTHAEASHDTGDDPPSAQEEQPTAYTTDTTGNHTYRLVFSGEE